MQTTQTHTPGPWIAERSGPDAFSIRSEDYGEITLMHDPYAYEQGRMAEVEANARLIAATPELLEACRDIESKIVDYVAGRINWRPDDFLMRVRAAIARAEGR